MAQPNVVREPSMDEILASIRRIIESNDPVPSAMPEPEGFSGSAANDDVEDVPLTIDEVFAPRADDRMQGYDHVAPVFEPQAPEVLRAPTPELPRTAEEPVQSKSLSLADVAARVRAASERNPALRDMAPKPAEAAPVAASSPLMTGRMAAAGGDRVVEVPRDSLGAVEQRPPVETHAEPVAEVLREIVAEVRIAEPAHEEAAPVALISSDAGQQVARSFQDLAVAVDQAERRSYDEIAAELLRPMLQEWLDENLPTLVERLVREEIERVARGNRR
jgi:uncharacterized protein